MLKFCKNFVFFYKFVLYYHYRSLYATECSTFAFVLPKGNPNRERKLRTQPTFAFLSFLKGIPKYDCTLSLGFSTGRTKQKQSVPRLQTTSGIPYGKDKAKVGCSVECKLRVQVTSTNLNLFTNQKVPFGDLGEL